MTSIEWTDETWNPVVGCSIVSAGCEHCYAMGVAHRGMAPEHRGLTVLRAHRKGPRWNGEVRFLPERLEEPLSWRKPRRVFVNSMSDLFHEALTFEQIAAVFGVMAAAHQHTFQVLTKRPTRARTFFEWLAAEAPGNRIGDVTEELLGLEQGVNVANFINGWSRWRTMPDDGIPLDGSVTRWPLPNVWLGVSVEDQKTADERIPVLLDLPAAIRWVSYEPALGPVAFRGEWLGRGRCALHDTDGGSFCNGCPDIVRGLDWIVVGGESGARARPFDIDWARSTVRVCADAGVPCFVKQLGARPVVQHPVGQPGELVEARLVDRKGGDMDEWPTDLRVRRWPEVRG